MEAEESLERDGSDWTRLSVGIRHGEKWRDFGDSLKVEMVRF